MNVLGYIIITAIIVFIVLFFATIILHGGTPDDIWVNLKTGEEVVFEEETDIIDPENNRRINAVICHTVIGHYIKVYRYSDFVIYFKQKNEDEEK